MSITYFPSFDITGIRPSRWYEAPRDWPTITEDFEYEDGAKDFNETADDAPRHWEYGHTGLTPEQAQQFDDFYDLVRLATPFYFTDKYGVTWTNVYIESYSRVHEAHKSWSITVNFRLVGYNSEVYTPPDPDARIAIFDTVTATLKYAFGFSKILSAYSGFCLKARNVSTMAAPVEIGFDANGNIDRGALLALISPGQDIGVHTYHDLFGNGIDAIVGTDYDILDLTGHRIMPKTGEAASLANGYTSVNTVNLANPVFFNVVDPFNYGQMFFGDHGLLGAGNYFSGRLLGGITVSPVTKQLYLNNGTAIQSDESAIYDSTNSDGLRQVTQIFQASDDRLRRDGIELTISGTADAGDTPRNGAVVVHHDFASGGGLGWSGRFPERICVEGISDADIALVEENQMAFFMDGPQICRFGDSYAYGQLLANVYTDNFIAQLKPSLPDGYDSYSRGFAGSTIPQLQALIPTVIAPLIRPTAEKYIFIVNGGTNDAVAGGVTAADIYDRMVAMVADLKALGSNVFVYVMTNPRATAWGGPGGSVDLLIQATNDLYAAGVTGADGVIDARANANIGHTANTATGYYSGDDAHPSDIGYAEFVPYAIAAVPF
jgi:hypothetical protein